MKYAFILGSNPALSLAEIIAKIKNAKLLSYSQEVAILEMEEIDKNLIDALGGTIKIVEIFQTIANQNELLDCLSKMIQNLHKKDTKFRFGISFYKTSGNSFNICLKLKKILKNFNIKLAFLNSRETYLSSASVIKNKLLDKNACEAVVIGDKNNIYVGSTKQVQNIDLYSFLDMGRPSRDLISGTTPPKLAKIMVNLANVNSSLTPCSLLLDSFSGSGTFLQEMALAGYKNLIGSDISQKAIDATGKNMDWLKEKRKLDFDLKLYQSDAKDLDKIIDPKSIDAIVSEVYLGPALLREPESAQLDKILTELNNLYKEILPTLSSILKPQGVIVLAMPIFKIGNGYKTLSLFDNLEKFKIIDPLANLDANWIKNYQTSRKTIIYHRPDQLVWREIIVLTSTKPQAPNIK